MDWWYLQYQSFTALFVVSMLVFITGIVCCWCRRKLKNQMSLWMWFMKFCWKQHEQTWQELELKQNAIYGGHNYCDKLISTSTFLCMATPVQAYTSCRVENGRQTNMYIILNRLRGRSYILHGWCMRSPKKVSGSLEPLWEAKVSRNIEKL